VLPDGIFSNQKCQFGLSLECLAMNDVGKFYGHLVYFSAIWSIFLQFGIFYSNLVYFAAIWYILCPFGIFVVILVKFSLFGLLYQEKSGNPGLFPSASKKVNPIKFSV
jgi:polyferredoxin